MSDNSTDPVISRDPNNFLAPVAGSFNVGTFVIYLLAAWLIYSYVFKKY